MKSNDVFVPQEHACENRLGLETIVLLSLLILLVFGSADILILVFSDWKHLFGIVNVPISRFEEVVFYAPFAKAFSCWNFLPIAPGCDKGLFGLSHMPFISIMLSGFIFKVVCLQSIDLYLLFCHSVLPLLNFWMLYKIFRLHLKKRWAIFLAFLSIGYYSSFSSINYVIGLLHGKSLIETASLAQPEISRTPFPALSLLLFLIPFYMTIKSIELNTRRILILTLLWAFQLYVYFFNFVAGLLYFVLWLSYACSLNLRKQSMMDLAKYWVFASFVVFLVVAPFISIVHQPIFQEIKSKLFDVVPSSIIINSWGVWAGYFFPLLIMCFTLYVFHADFYEVFYRFTPIFIAVAVDFCLGALPLLFKDISPELYGHRISNILFRFFYFIPFLYFVSIPYKKVTLIKHEFFTRILEGVRKELYNVFYTRNVILIFAGLSLMTSVVFLGGVRAFYNHQQLVTKRMESVFDAVMIGAKAKAPKNSCIVFDDIAANLLIPTMTPNTTLLVSHFSNFVPDHFILERLVLYAKIFNWSKESFVNFMLPSKNMAILNSYTDNNAIVETDFLNHGLGYRLYMHNKKLDSRSLSDYKKKINDLFKDCDLEQLIRKFNVSVVVAKRGDLSLPFDFDVSKSGQYHVYKRGNHS